MKLTILFFVAFPLFSFAQEKTVFLCQSASHTLQIKQAQRTKRLVGTLSSTSERPHRLNCEAKEVGYVCKTGDFVVKVMRGTTGRMIVQLELEGEFDVESGYIDTIYCR